MVVVVVVVGSPVGLVGSVCTPLTLAVVVEEIWLSDVDVVKF